MGVITSSSPTLKQKKTKTNWFGLIRRKLFLFRSSSSYRQTTTLSLHLHTNNITTTTTSSSTTFNQKEEKATTREIDQLNAATDHTSKLYYFFPQEDIAAIIIQSYFRRHLARRAFRALRSLVKLQGVVRGVIERRQARIALDCMHALARLHHTVRARQLLLLTN